MKLPLVFLFALLPCWASAEQLYRCGNTYSQTPCAADATAKKMPSSAAPDAGAGVHGEALCATEGLLRMGVPDPEEARVLGVTKVGTEVIQYADKPTAARKYAVRLNPRNPGGGYGGEQVFHCFLSEDGRRILAVGNPRR